MPADFAARFTQKPTVEKRRTCTSCGRLGHLAATCPNHEKYHDMIGIEIEGWWWDLPAIQELARKLTGSAGRRDGSLREISSCNGSDEDRPDDFQDPDVEDCEEGCDDCPHPVARRTSINCARRKKDCKSCGARSWEFQTKPGSIGEALRQLTQLYPEVTSRAAGLHVHMSFKEKTSITLLCSDAFFSYWKTRWEEWGTKLNVKGAFWERLKNENNYCRPNAITEFTGKALVNANGGDRYKQINFNAIEKFGTVEFRLLPMFQKGNLAVNAVETLVDIVETFLQTYDLDTEIKGQETTMPKTKDAPMVLEAVIQDFDLPVAKYAPVTCEVDLETDFGNIKKFKSGPTEHGTVRMLRHEVPDFLQKLASNAQDKLNTVADPKRNKVNWETFNPDPEHTSTRR
jgi:hypothetical protein